MVSMLLLRGYFFLPAPERERLWCGEWCFLSLFAGRFFSTRVMSGVAVCGGVCLRFYVRGYYF